MIDIIGPFTQESSQYVLEGCMVGYFTKETIGAMKFSLALSNYWFISQYVVMLVSMTLEGILFLLFAGQWDTNACFLLTQHPCGCIYVRIKRRFLRGCKPLDMIWSYFPLIFNLYGGKKFTPLFMGYETILLDFILQFTLHRCRDSILCGNTNIMLREFFVAESPIYLIILTTLHWSCR